jgi:hypothetical protein
MAASRSALRAGDLTRERRHLGIGGIARYVDEALMSARVAEAGGDKMMHTKVAHVAQRHRLAGLFVFEIGAQLFVGAFS